jgi:hypothetical protein
MSQASVRKIFYNSSQNNVPNWIDRFQKFAFAGLHRLIGSKLISLNCKNSPPSADQTVCNLTFRFSKNRKAKDAKGFTQIHDRLALRKPRPLGQV